MLAERSRFRPELIKALDEIFVYDDIPKFSLEVMLARFPSKYLDSVAKFINDKVVAKNKYLESIHSKETLDEPITTCVDEKCVVTRPNPDMATYDFFVGYNEESYIAGMIIDFNSSSEKEEEKSLLEQNEEYEREKQDFDNMNFDILFHKYEDVQLTDDELDDSSTIELINSKKNLMSYDEELEDDEDEFLDDEDEEESVKLSSDVQAALDLFQKEKEASDHFLFEQYYDDGKEYTDSDYLLEYSDEDEEEDDDDEDFLASMIR